MANLPLDWLIRRPIAHRGLHDLSKGIIENCESAFAAAITKGFAIECDLQVTRDGEAVVFHDDETDRLLEGKGAVKSFTSSELKGMAFRNGSDRIQTLGELLAQVNGRVPLVIEIKSLWDDDDTLTMRAVKLLTRYTGPFALMSFDPDLMERVATLSPKIVRGFTADQVHDPYYDSLPPIKLKTLRNYWQLPYKPPDFVSFNFSELPFPPVSAFRAKGGKVITWTIRSATDAAQALRHSDQITFENFIPELA